MNIQLCAINLVYECQITDIKADGIQVEATIKSKSIKMRKLLTKLPILTLQNENFKIVYRQRKKNVKNILALCSSCYLANSIKSKIMKNKKCHCNVICNYIWAISYFIPVEYRDIIHDGWHLTRNRFMEIKEKKKKKTPNKR